MLKSSRFWFFISLVLFLFILVSFFPGFFGIASSYKNGQEPISIVDVIKKPFVPVIPPLDIEDYDKRMNELANNPAPKPPVEPVDPEAPPLPPPKYLWPVQTVYPNTGALLPFNRIIAYYGNLYSKKMGALGQYPEEEMLIRLDREVKKWEEADPSTPVLPALHYIAVVAQADAGADGKYRFRMPDSEIDKVIAMAEKIDAIVFLDIQVGLSDLQSEVPKFEKYLKMPQVHLGVDPEFSMKTGAKPGTVVGTLDAEDVNFAANYLAKLVKENNLTPKILVVHRYTQKMLTNYKMIKPLPEVQIVMHMDGWGSAAKKVNTYKQFVYKEPVQFAGFKLFYKNDLFDPGTVLMTPEDLLKLTPRPIYIQFQ
jgi:hypothetical protein